jgi:hypothetical protein
MSSALPSIAQDLVTDPLESSAGGYILVARSPGMINQDADFIAASPGISDYLHNLQPPQPHFYSFFPLPSRQYALVHRFIKDSRRGVNRVIVHLLVLSEALLSTVQGDI